MYVNKGTRQDYEGLDVTGKIVLLDIDQRNDWWITYPMLEAMAPGRSGRAGGQRWRLCPDRR